MPITTISRLTPRQAALIASLETERVVPASCRDRIAAARGRTLTRGAASGLIEELMNAPRVPALQSGDAVPLPPPSVDYRAGRMLRAGGIEATVTLLNGRHVTVTVRTRRRSGRGWTNAAPGEDGARTTIRILGNRVGYVTSVGLGWRVSYLTSRAEYRTAVQALFDYAAGLPTARRVQEASRCGRCFRTLTDPVSIQRGIGPECFGRSTGSQHVERDERSATFVAEAVAAQVDQTAAEHVARVNMEFVTSLDRAEQGANDEHAEIVSASVEPFETEPAVPVRRRSTSDRRKQRARDLIAEALDSYASDADRDFALAIFDQLAAAAPSAEPTSAPVADIPF